MAKTRIPMRKIKETLRLVHELGLSQRQAARAIHVAPSTVQECMTRAKRAGVSWPLPVDMDDAAVERLLYKRDDSGVVSTRAKPGWQCAWRSGRRV